jgi:hypothetical protein
MARSDASLPLIHRSAWKGNSRKLTATFLHNLILSPKADAHMSWCRIKMRSPA